MAARCDVCGETLPKFRNEKVVVDGIKFDSKKEGDRYLELKMREKIGEIFGLKVHPKYPIVIDDVKVCTYEADFSYGDARKHCEVIEDAKGKRTREFILKKKLMLAVHGIAIKEI